MCHDKAKKFIKTLAFLCVRKVVHLWRSGSTKAFKLWFVSCMRRTRMSRDRIPTRKRQTTTKKIAATFIRCRLLRSKNLIESERQSSTAPLGSRCLWLPRQSHRNRQKTWLTDGLASEISDVILTAWLDI